MILSSEYPLRTREGGLLRARTAIFGDNQQTACVIYSDELTRSANLRVQYGCLFGTTFGSLDCDCGLQMQRSLERVGLQGGAIIYFKDHEAYGYGLFDKSEMLSQEHRSIDAQRRLVSELVQSPCRHAVLHFAVEILLRIGVKRVDHLLGGSAEKLSELQRCGLVVGNIEPLPVLETELSEFGWRDVEERTRKTVLPNR